MKRSFVFLVLFSLAGLIISWAAATVLTGLLGLLLWFFVWGDNYTSSLLSETSFQLFYWIIFIAGWAKITIIGLNINNKLERGKKIDKKVWLVFIVLLIPSVLFSIHYLLEIYSQDLGISYAVKCENICTEKGYLKSLTPERFDQKFCECYGDSYSDVKYQIPLDELKGINP